MVASYGADRGQSVFKKNPFADARAERYQHVMLGIIAHKRTKTIARRRKPRIYFSQVDSEGYPGEAGSDVLLFGAPESCVCTSARVPYKLETEDRRRGVEGVF